ncbi:MAG: hypothetical protein V2B19_28980 [Pseudomonadota bacterium]
MIIIPKGEPVVENLNSFYLDIDKMIEHFQGELGSGCVHFSSPSDEGLIFFDKDDLLNGVLKNDRGETVGDAAIKLIVKAAAVQNFTVDIFKIESDKVYFWANIPYAKKIHSNLSTQFTDLEKLVKNMSSEKLTGFIDISINNEKEGGFIFFSNGELVGEFYSGNSRNLTTSKNELALLFQETKSKGGVFNVSGIPVRSGGNAPKRNAPADPVEPSNPFGILEELLDVFEKLITSQKKLRLDYNNLLKKKFLEKVVKYEFLDPFAAEFKYVNKTVHYKGKSNIKVVIFGVVECVRELATDLNLLPLLTSQLKSWAEKYDKEIKLFNIRF